MRISDWSSDVCSSDLNTDANDGLYTRPSAVEAQINEAVRLSRSDLQARLSVTDRNDPAYLRSECLVHLVREGRRANDQQLMSAVLPVQIGRASCRERVCQYV